MQTDYQIKQITPTEASYLYNKGEIFYITGENKLGDFGMSFFTPVSTRTKYITFKRLIKRMTNRSQYSSNEFQYFSRKQKINA